MSDDNKQILRIHLLARPNAQAGKVVKVSADELETGDWRVTPQSADAALGSELHLHEFQKERSWRAGVITGWRHHESGNGRLVFKFRVNDALCRYQSSGWPHRGEICIVRQQSNEPQSGLKTNWPGHGQSDILRQGNPPDPCSGES